MTILGPFLWPYFLIFPPLEQPAKNLFLEAAVLESSSSRKTSWTSVESVALPGLSTLNFCPICVHLGDLECGPGSLFPSLKGPTVSSGQMAGAGRGGGTWVQGEGAGEFGMVNPLLSLMEMPRLHTGSLLPRSCGDVDLAGPPD